MDGFFQLSPICVILVVSFPQHITCWKLGKNRGRLWFSWKASGDIFWMPPTGPQDACKTIVHTHNRHCIFSIRKTSWEIAAMLGSAALVWFFKKKISNMKMHIQHCEGEKNARLPKLISVCKKSVNVIFFLLKLQKLSPQVYKLWWNYTSKRILR